MKPRKNIIRTAIAVGCCASLSILPTNAEVLFSDNYDATGPGTPNDQITNPGRQSGTLAPLGYVQRDNIQIGNTGTLPPSPGSDLGDEMLAAYGGEAMIDHDFSDTTLPLQITWTGIITSRDSGSAPVDWTCLIIGPSAGAPYVNNPAADSILMRANGGSQIFDHGVGTDGANGPAPGLDVWTEYKVILSDTAGTGSAFGTGGTRADYYVGGTFVGTANFAQLGAGQGYFGFSANLINGYDNVTVSTISPTPSGYAAWAASKGLDGTPGKENGPNDDPDKDGLTNAMEYAFNGNPLSNADRGQIYYMTADSDYALDPSAGKELILTVAVLTGTPAFSGTTSQTAIIDGTTYTVSGSTDLATFNTAVHPVTPITTGLPAAGAGYEYRSFSLEGSDGLPSKGFLRAGAAR